jgi:1,4-alpha-glucan branching enzyme
MVTVRGRWAEFRFLRPGATRVDVVGDFTSWRPGELPMHRSADGAWQARVRLPAGMFRFRYWADGQAFTDYAAFGVEPGPEGPVAVVYVPSDTQPEREVTSC